MSSSFQWALLPAVLVVFGAGVAVAKPHHARTTLSASAGVPATGKIDATLNLATPKKSERSRLRLSVGHLPKLEPITLSILTPGTGGGPPDLDQLAGPYTASKRGKLRVDWDTKDGGALPLGLTLDELSTRTLQVRDSDGQLLLVGVFPAVVR
jgi:hypothetical protein